MIERKHLFPADVRYRIGDDMEDAIHAIAAAMGMVATLGDAGGLADIWDDNGVEIGLWTTDTQIGESTRVAMRQTAPGTLTNAEPVTFRVAPEAGALRLGPPLPPDSSPADEYTYVWDERSMCKTCGATVAHSALHRAWHEAHEPPRDWAVDPADLTTPDAEFE